MLILFGGFFGSGRRDVATAVARQIGFKFYNIDTKKLRSFTIHKDGVRELVVHPKNDAARMKIYGKIVEEFPLLAKMHTGIVIEDAFHREAPRRYFLEEARKYFGTVFFVWVESDDRYADDRFRVLKDSGRITSIERARRRRKRSKQLFQEFTEAPFVFTCREAADTNEDATRLAQILTEKLGLPKRTT